MSFQDKSLQCFDCAATYVFSAQEQEAFQAKGLTNAPKRCPACRAARKERQSQTSGYRNAATTYSPRRQMFPAKCARCGKDTQVPFEPREGRPVYCSDCYSNIRVSR